MRKLIFTLFLGLTIAAPSASASEDNKFAEGQAFTYASGASYQPAETRRLNKTQVFVKTFKVSGTSESVAKYGRDSEFAMRMAHAMLGWRVDVEDTLINASASAAGSSGVARGMNGLRAQDGISATANATSGSLSPVDEGNLNVLLQLMWDQGVDPDKLVCSSFVKRQISGFAGLGAGRPIIMNNGEKTLSDIIDIYESDFGRLNLIASRRLAAKSEVLVYQNNTVAVALLRPPFVRETPNDGDFRSGAIVGELTFEYLNVNALGRLRRVTSS